MKIQNEKKFKKELAEMFHYKWNCINNHIRPMIADDLIAFILEYKDVDDK